MTEPPPLRSEVEYALKKLKSNKSPGLDNIPAELIKAGGPRQYDQCSSQALLQNMDIDRLASRLETTRNGHATQSRGLEGMN